MRIVEPGISTVQDGGRADARRYGFPDGGPLDAESWAIANAVVGNHPGPAAIELLAGTLEVELRGRVAVATFDASLHVDGRTTDPWQAVEVTERVRLVARSTSYLAVAGGIDVGTVLGSRSTLGERLRAGDVLPVGDPPPLRARLLARPPLPGSGPLRIVLGPQADRFAADALFGRTWTVGRDVDRMGVRLTGPPLRPLPGPMLSDGIVPGAIQVPPDGQPIILLADAPTTGGYPKPGVVVGVDLARAGRLRTGDEVRFQVVSIEEAHALRAAARDLSPTSSPLPASEELLGANLVSGAIDVTEETGRCGST